MPQCHAAAHSVAAAPLVPSEEQQGLPENGCCWAGGIAQGGAAAEWPIGLRLVYHS
jgi:hypothetical protein